MATAIEKRKKNKVKTILISQPKPKSDRSPYFDLAKKRKLTIDWRKFIQIDGVDSKEFRKSKINIAEFSAVIFTSKLSITHFFRIAEEFRITVSSDIKYFCSSEAIALFLQKFIEYRKRKVFFEKEGKATLFDLLTKHKENETFLFTCAVQHTTDIPDFLESNGFKFSNAALYEVVSSDLSDLKEIYYDMIVFFSPLGIKSLFDNFPDFEQSQTRIAAFGTSTYQACLDHGLEADVRAPIPEVTSMTGAIERYLDELS